MRSGELSAIHALPIWGGSLKLRGPSRLRKELHQTMLVIFPGSDICRLNIPDDADSFPVATIGEIIRHCVAVALG